MRVQDMEHNPLLRPSLKAHMLLLISFPLHLNPTISYHTPFSLLHTSSKWWCHQDLSTPGISLHHIMFTSNDFCQDLPLLFLDKFDEELIKGRGGVIRLDIDVGDSILVIDSVKELRVSWTVAMKSQSEASSQESDALPQGTYIAITEVFNSFKLLHIQQMVSGETLDRELSRVQESAYYSVLFYASWCPFSHKTRTMHDALSSMFPQIIHLAVEESSSMPSLFSRYGIHSFPSILIASGTTRVQYHGSKDLSSLVNFYEKTTGLDPVAYFAVDQPSSSGNAWPLLPWEGSPREIIRNEPYLVFGLLFICLKASLRFFPGILSRFKALWVSYAWHLNLGVLGESTQLLEGVLHVIDVKRLWSKLRLCNKTRNFQKGAKNARVWASSLASVSLGESSSRSALSDS